MPIKHTEIEPKSNQNQKNNGWQIQFDYMVRRPAMGIYASIPLQRFVSNMISTQALQDTSIPSSREVLPHWALALLRRRLGHTPQGRQIQSF